MKKTQANKDQATRMSAQLMKRKAEVMLSETQCLVMDQLCSNPLAKETLLKEIASSRISRVDQPTNRMEGVCGKSKMLHNR